MILPRVSIPILGGEYGEDRNSSHPALVDGLGTRQPIRLRGLSREIDACLLQPLWGSGVY